MSYVNKSDLIAAVADAADIPRNKAEKAINSVFDQIAVHTGNGHEVRIAGFGAFKPVERASRRVKLRGVEGQTRAHLSVGFKPYEALKSYDA